MNQGWAMDTQQQTTQPISDDQELAKVLAGVSNMSDGNLEFEETPVPALTPDPNPQEATAPAITTDPIATPTSDSLLTPVIGYNPPADVSNNDGAGSLDDIKKDALIELRPLIDKLDLAPEEKFDIYLLLLRSTDDKTLIAPAHITAQNIADETRRAQALLDIIKEIDYLSNPSQTTI
jgi:hypothetical protein